MEYQALYRKWRPSKFDDVFGQDHVTSTLKNQIQQEKIGHAYLFTGTRGTGKTTCAKILAKAVNCLSPQNGEPCNTCENCRLFEQESLYDVVEIDAASKSRVEDIRSIIEEVVYAPSVGKRKVYIIDEVQMMTNNAFNALLKTLEEPPEYVVFILATTEVQKIPATILSRCQRFDFKRLPVSVITARLNQVAKHENITLDPQAAEMIALLADGAMRDALSILEQCQTAGTVSRETVLETVGIVGCEELLELIGACAEHDIAKAMLCLDGFYTTSKRMDTLMSEMIGCYRDILLIKMNAPECVHRSGEERELLCKMADVLSCDYIFYCIDQLTKAIASTSKNNGNLTVAQMSIIRLCRPNESDTVASASPSVTAPITKPSSLPIEKKEAPKPVEPTPSISPQNTAVGNEDFYKNMLANIKMPNIRFCIPQKGAYANNELSLYATAKSEYDLACRPETQKHIRDACAALGVENCTIRVIPPNDMPRKTEDNNDTFSL